MHFIGNRAIILGNGESEIQLVYSPGYSTLSVFLPIIGLSVAFATAEYPFRSPTLQWIALICTGVFAGLSIVGMHYMGNFGTSNYKLQYEPQYLAASIIIAIGDCLAVLVLFYTLREKWISDWRKRFVCALFLAGGVSAMHFTASTNCIYILQKFSGDAAMHSRNVQVAVAGTFCGTAVAIILGVLFYTRRRSRVLRRSSRKVMLACAMFDPDGRILVTTEGVLPAREITDKFNPRTFDEEFDKTHPVFQWIFRVSRNWSSVSELIPKMKSHIGANNANGDPKPSSSTSSTAQDHETPSDYSIIFRERFCVAAASLASSMHLPVEKVGVLYDNILDTGTLKTEDRRRKRKTIGTEQSARDLESGSEVSVFGRGQLLFLIRRLKADDVDKLLNAGFKFGTMQQVGRNIAETMQIPLSALEMQMSGLKHYIDNLSALQKPGTWLSCFAMIPKPNTKGFDVAVKKREQDQLPDVQLLPSGPLQWQANFLQRMNEKPMPHCISFLEDRHNKDTARTQQEQQFALVVLQAIMKLSEQLPSPWLQTARFYGKPVYAHYSRPLRSRALATTLYSFVVCTDLHTSIESCRDIIRIPLSFFSVRHQCYYGSPNHSALAREIHKEFGPLLARKTAKQTDRVKKSSTHMPNKSTQNPTKPIPRHPSITRLSTDDQTDASSDTHELVDKPNSFIEITPNATTPASERDNIWGGILVNSETVVKSDSMSDFNNDTPNIGLDVSMRVAVETSKPEDTFVDELCTFTRATIPSKAGH